VYAAVTYVVMMSVAPKEKGVAVVNAVTPMIVVTARNAVTLVNVAIMGNA